MNICVFGGHSHFLKPIIFSLKRKGHYILFNQFNKNVDVVIVQSHTYMYEIYKVLKKIKKNKIKLINIILDIPPWRLEHDFYQNSISKYLRQTFYNISHKFQFINRNINTFFPIAKKNNNCYSNSEIIDKIINTEFRNRIFYQINYKKFLKFSDLNLSISRFTQKLVKKFLKINSEVWYPGVNSDIILSLPKPQYLKYDVINISRIVQTKSQQILVKAAKILGLNMLIIGNYQDKRIKLECPHYELQDHRSILKKLSEARFYVDASIFEGFGLTPVEAAFLDKITIASDTVVHREILEDYPLYFKKNDVKDLVDKLKFVINGNFILNKAAVEKIKEKYSIKSARNRLEKYIETLF